MKSSLDIGNELLKWWHSELPHDAVLPAFLTPFTIYASPLELLEGNEILRRVQAHLPWENLVIIGSCHDDSVAALMFEGTDPVTGLKHRASWLVTVTQERVERVDAVLAIVRG